MTYERVEVPKIEGTKLIEPYYPENDNCVYCEGSYPVDPTRFDVILTNDIKIEKVCSVCLYEVFLEHPKYIKQINKRGN